MSRPLEQRPTVEENKDIDPEIEGIDPEIDFMATERELYQPPERQGRHLSDSIVDFVEKFAEGEPRIRFDEYPILL